MSERFGKTKQTVTGVPVDKELYNRVKSEAKAKFDRWPSALGSAWLVKTYKERGGKYRKP
jgi:hypothetical protein